ncbi:LysR substrate-binding domain-containing protein [Paenibacillus sp. MBLB4367]|uniref:LysR family transcriptional regulator n=1 Tax=Paenibacillus sp. MBLB4367 TaxID=3384767 RepID=UPI003907F04B
MSDLDIFATVVEQQSLNRASAFLNLSQPALSRKMIVLENALGVQLFHRKGKRLELTRAGQICYEYAVKMRGLNRELMQALSPFASGQIPPSVTIGASLTTLQSTLPELITLFTKDYPQTEILALTGKTHEIVLMVKEKKVDLGLVASVIDHPGIHCVPLFDDHLCLVLPPSHSFLERTHVRMSDMNELPMILFSKGTWYRIMTDDLFHRYAVFPNVRMEIDSFEAIIRLVPTCNVATLLPMSYLRSSLLETGDLHIRNIPELMQTKRTTSLIYTDDASGQASINPFIWKAKDYFMREGE